MYIHCTDKTLIKFVLYCSKNNILWAPRLLNSCTILIHIHCDKYLAFHYSFKTFLSQVVVLLIFYKLLQCCWVNWDIQIFYTISTLLGSYKFVITKFYQLSFKCWVTVYKELFTAFGVTRIKWQPNITTVILFIKLMLCY